MTITHKRILVLYLLIIIVGAVTPLLLYWDDKLRWSLDITRTISILSASILALFYFDPFDIRKNNLAKQHENIIQILEKTFTQRIVVITESSNPKSKFSKMYSQHFMTTKNLKCILTDNSDSEYLNYPVLFNLENFIEQTKELVELRNSLFTPKTVSEKMKFLEFISATRTTKEYESFSIVTWGGSQNKDQDELYDQINNEKLTLRELLKNYQDMIDECIYWFETNSFSIKHLNIK